MNLQKIFLKCSSNASNLSGNLFYLEGGGVVFPVFCALTHKTHVFSLWVFWKQQPYMNINILVLGSLALVDLLCRTFSQLKTPLPFHILWSMPCNGLETKWNMKNTTLPNISYHKISCFLNDVLHCDILWYLWNQNYISRLVNYMYIKQSNSAMEIFPVTFALQHILGCTLSDLKTRFLAFSRHLVFRMDIWR